MSQELFILFSTARQIIDFGYYAQDFHKGMRTKLLKAGRRRCCGARNLRKPIPPFNDDYYDGEA
jgi:hypothetical protein